MKLFPNVTKSLRELKDRDTSMAVVSNLPRWFVEPLLEHFNLVPFFKISIYCARKPSPSGLLSAAQGLAVPIGNGIFYVGDLQSDALAAKAAGFSFVWASYGYSREKILADITLGDFSDVLVL